MPFHQIAQAMMQGRNQVLLEMRQDENAPADEDCLTEIRVHVPQLDDGGGDDELGAAAAADADGVVPEHKVSNAEV